MDCFASLAMTQTHLRDLATRCVRGLQLISALKTEGVGNAGRPMHPQPRVRYGSKYAHEYSQRAIGKHPTFPHAMGYGLYRALPGDRLSCHRHQRLPANLTPASGCQDHTSSPSAASNARQARRRVHRIPPRVRDVASRPSEWDGMGRDILLIWVRPQAMFLKIRSEPKCRRGRLALRARMRAR